MPDHFAVGKVNAVLVHATPEDQKKITNAFGGKLFYKTASDVDTEDTELAVGSSVTVDANNWIISETESKVVVDPKVGSTVQDLTITDDLTVTDKATVTGELEVDGALNHDGTKVGFFGTAPVVVQEVTKEAEEEKKATTAELQEALEALGLIKEEA